MEEMKKRIEAFIASHKDAKIESGAFIIGGKGKTPDSIMTAENGGDCTNENYDACHNSTNRGSCQNVAFMCNDSKNGGSCKNIIQQANKDMTCK